MRVTKRSGGAVAELQRRVKHGGRGERTSGSIVAEYSAGAEIDSVAEIARQLGATPLATETALRGYLSRAQARRTPRSRTGIVRILVDAH